jgi:dTDP-4-dehydrorhamnose 3,5-epimerase-like enzyme
MIKNCSIIDLKVIDDNRGTISIIEGGITFPFPIERSYFLHNVAKGSSRGGHSHKSTYQCLVAISGSFDVVLSDGDETKIIHLNNPNKGLIIVPNVWRVLENFSEKSICLVYASKIYDEDEYERNFEIFLKNKKNENH